jgi:FixJ family two-component response regulator
VFCVGYAQEVSSSLSHVLTITGYQVRAFATAERFLDEQGADTPGCLLLEVCMPGMSGLDLQRMLIGPLGARPVVFFTGHGDIQTSVLAMKAGAVDFLTQPLDETRLFAALDQAIRRDVAERGEREIRKTIQNRFQRLTARERQVMELVILGRLNKQIAAELRIAEKTIKVHRARVMSKIQVRSVAELVQRATRVGMIIDPVLAIGSSSLTGKQSPVQYFRTGYYGIANSHAADEARP